MIKKCFTSVLIISLIIIADQYSKLYLISYLKTRPSYIIEVTSFFDIVYAWNYGASFGLFKQYYQYSNYAFIALNSLIVSLLLGLIIRARSGFEYIPFSLIVGGALGNIIDRVMHGAVFDFLYFHYNNYHFPVFNIADSFISIGAGLYFLEYYLSKRNLAIKNKTLGN